MHDAILPIPVANTQQVEWDDLRIFLAVLRAGSVRGAAGQLGFHASTISRRLASLEATLGTQLFERHPTGLVLTSAGEEAAELGRGLEEEVRELCLRLARHDTELDGLIRITTAEIVSALSARLIQTFLRQHPKITIDLRISDSMLSIERHETDLAVRVADAPGEDLVGRRVGRCMVGLFASRSYLDQKKSAWTSEEHTFVDWPRAVEHKPAFRWLDSHLPTRIRRLRANSASAVLTCARAGLGIAPLGLLQGKQEPELVLLTTLPPECATDVWLLTHRHLRATARVRAALDFLGDALAHEFTAQTPDDCTLGGGDAL